MGREAWRSLVEARPGCEFQAVEWGYLHRYPLPTETLNRAVLTRPPPDPVEAVGAAARFFEHRTPRWSVLCPLEWAPRMDPACRAAGLESSPPHPTLVLPSSLYRPSPATAGLTFRSARDWPGLVEFGRAFSRANEIPDTDFWLSRGLLESPDWDFLVGFLDEEPVATGIGFTHDGVTGLWGIATVPASRGRGIGGAITWEVIRGGARRGATAAHLWATEMGYPVYRRMGFRHVRSHAEWTRSTGA
jgi:GNAT superfamily N-acetyltransferase